MVADTVTMAVAVLRFLLRTLGSALLMSLLLAGETSAAALADPWREPAFGVSAGSLNRASLSTERSNTDRSNSARSERRAEPRRLLTVALRAYHQRTEFGASEWFGGLELQIALDRVFLPTGIAQEDSDASAPPAEAPATLPPLPPPSPPTSSASLPLSPASESPGASLASEPSPGLRVNAELARAVVSAVQAAAGLPGGRVRLDSLLRRARHSALLPEVAFRLGRNSDQSLRFAPTQGDPYSYTSTGGADWRVEGRVTWQLDRLIYVKEELAVERMRRTDAEDEVKRSRVALELLFDWQLALLEEADAELPAPTRLEATLRRLQAEVQLDALTGGWFSQIAAPRPDSPTKSRTQARGPSSGKSRKNKVARSTSQE